MTSAGKSLRLNVADGAVHQFARPLESFLKRSSLVRGTSPNDAPEALVEDSVSPACAHQVCHPHPDQKVPKRSRMQDARIVDDDEGHAVWLARPPRRAWRTQ